MKKMIFAIGLLFTVLASSCITNKELVYLQETDNAIIDSLGVHQKALPYRVQVNDILKINVKALDQSLVEIFNPTNVENSASSNENLYFNGFTVDVHGNIKFPVLGNINVLGYTIEEVEKLVKTKLLNDYFKETARIFVNVKLAGLRYTVTGEVASPGTITLFQDRVNIIEALANAGDIKSAGDRKDVVIVRQYPHGQKIHHIDLTSVEALQSPYYYIKPNDMILVKPLKRKALGTGETAVQSFTTIASIFSVVISTYFLIRNL